MIVVVLNRIVLNQLNTIHIQAEVSSLKDILQSERHQQFDITPILCLFIDHITAL